MKAFFISRKEEMFPHLPSGSSLNVSKRPAPAGCSLKDCPGFKGVLSVFLCFKKSSSKKGGDDRHG